MTGHTPAPWSVAHYGDDERPVIKRGMATIATPHDLPEREQNARLIAAAPELLEALQECITDDNACAIVTNDVAYLIRRLRAINAIAREAIAKAEGQHA